MGRSQRHKVYEQGQASNGEWIAQGTINPVVADILKEYVAAYNPTLDYLDPDHGVMGGGYLTVNVYGQNFDETCVVEFGGVDVVTTFTSDTQLYFTAAIPELTEGTYDVLVRKDTLKTDIVPFGVLPQEAFRK